MTPLARRSLLALVVCLWSAPLQAQIDEGIRLSADRLGLFGSADGPQQQVVEIIVTVSDPQCAEFVVKPQNVNWLSVNKTHGFAPDGVRITIDYSTFSVNEERATSVTFESVNKAINPPGTHCLDPVGEGVVIFRQTLPITAKLLPAGPIASPQPSPFLLSLNASPGSLQPVSTFLDMTNSGGGSYNYIFEIAYLGSANGWLSVNPTGGTVSNTSVRHQVTANPVGLAAGTYNANLRVLHDAPLAPIITIPVSFSLSGPAGGPPVISVAPGNLTGAVRRGKQNPPPASISVRNNGGGTLAYQIASTVPWMTVSPALGEASGETAVAHTVTFSALNLPLGTHTGQLRVTSPTPGVTNSPQTVLVTVTVTPGGTISVVPAELQVSHAVGSSERQQIRLRLESPDLDRLSWRASLDPPNVQWLRLVDRGGTLPATIAAELDAASVPRPLQVTAAIVVEAFDPADIAALAEEGDGKEQAANAIIRTIVPVRLQAVSQTAELQVAPSRVEMVAVPGGGTRIQPISIAMGGGAPGLPWQASVEPRRGGDVFSIAPSSGAGPGVIEVTAQPSGLSAGVYDADVVIRSGAEEQRVPAALLVAAPGQAVLSAGQTAVAIRGSAASQAKQIAVVNLGDGASPNVQVRPSVLTGAGWLSGTPNGSSFLAQTQGNGLTPGVRHGLLEITAAGASNSPLYLPVVYERQAPGADPELVLDRGGLVFTSVGGSLPAAQTVNVATTSDSALPALVGVATDANSAWLSATPTDGQAAAPTPLAVSVQANPAGLAPGVHRGRVTVAMPGGPSQAVRVTLVVAPAGPCTPTHVVVAPIQPPDGFRAVAGHPVTVEAGLLDNCGFPLRGGVVAAHAASGAALRDMGETAGAARGPRMFRGTLQFPAPGAASIELRGAGTGLTGAGHSLSGTIVASAGGMTARSATPPVHAATFGLGRPLAPGAIATVFGTGFPTPPSQPSTLPLPESLQGFAVEVGGRPAPLFFLNATQANLQIPAEAPVNTLLQSIVRVGEAYLPAETFFTASAQPGLFGSGQNRAVVINQDGAVNTPSAPAARGQIIVAYLTGIGATLPAVPTGQGAPGAEPFARPALPAAATVGGADAEILFLGLTPGFVGLTQANLRIGGGSATGADIPLVLDIGGHKTPPMSIAVSP